MKKQRKNEVLHVQVVEKLKAVRKSRGLKQEEVFLDTDINIGRVEAGLHSITLSTLADLCDYYGVTLEEFFRGVKTR